MTPNGLRWWHDDQVDGGFDADQWSRWSRQADATDAFGGSWKQQISLAWAMGRLLDGCSMPLVGALLPWWQNDRISDAVTANG